MSIAVPRRQMWFKYLNSAVITTVEIALRVAPEIDSARIAICWVNWDIDAEKFSL
ncbi:hypothetical protein [Nostoc sp.]|uniref:hypothetical protein n=1 Tax=Nostoc sp. TaxID=1180 RepID=UPI002FF4B094